MVAFQNYFLDLGVSCLAGRLFSPTLAVILFLSLFLCWGVLAGAVSFIHEALRN